MECFLFSAVCFGAFVLFPICYCASYQMTLRENQENESVFWTFFVFAFFMRIRIPFFVPMLLPFTSSPICIGGADSRFDFILRVFIETTRNWRFWINWIFETLTVHFFVLCLVCFATAPLTFHWHFMLHRNLDDGIALCLSLSFWVVKSVFCRFGYYGCFVQTGCSSVLI